MDKDEKSFCFGCSKANPIGLQLEFTLEDDVIKGVFTPGEYHQGWPGAIHGGILFSLLDEAGGYAVIHSGLDCVTARCDMRFSSMAPVGETIYITAAITKKTSRLVETDATLTLKDGSVVARNHSLWYVVGKNSR
ncbi:MAG: PaaI family thioesterase [Dehalococcoidia bacterium]